MRTLQEFHDDMLNFDLRHEKAGIDPKATHQLYEDTKDLTALMDREGRTGRGITDSVRVVAERFARMDMNAYPEHMRELARSSDLGEGEVMSQNARVYRLRMMNPDSRDTMESHVVNVMDEMAEQHPEYRELFEQMDEDMMQRQAASEWESQQDSFEKETYQRIVSLEGLDLDTPYEELPASVTARLEESGVSHNPFENEDKSLSSASGRDTISARNSALDAKFGHLMDGEESDGPDYDF